MYLSRVRIIQTIILFALAVVTAVSQTPEGSPRSVIITGEVTSIDQKKLVVNAKEGPVEIELSEKTEFKRIPPENPSLKAAVAAAFSDISVGDNVAISRIVMPDGKTLPARTVYLTKKADIAQKQAKEAEQWRTRGIAGKVVNVDPVAKKFTVEVRGLTGVTNTVVIPKDNAKFMRYAPNSVKFSEAQASNITEIGPGDMVRALGDKNTDGTEFSAEEIVSGAFQTRAGTVKSIDTAKNEIVVTDLQSKKDLTIVVTSSSIVKRFPEEMAQRMAQMQMAGMNGMGARPVGQGGQPGQTPGAGQPSNRGGQGGFGGQRGGGIDDMLERFPNITPADLKAGDVIAVSSTKNGNVDHITAIKLLAGVEPFLRAAQMSAAGQRGPQRSLDLNIPGLDGFGTP